MPLANAVDPDFFLRKANDWMLRDHARTAPDRMAAFVRAHPESAVPPGCSQALQ